MKKLISKLLMMTLIFIGSFIGYSTVLAYNSSLLASKSIVNPEDTFTIQINMTGLTNGLGSANYNLTFDDTLFEYVSTSSKATTNLVGNTIKFGFLDTTGGDNTLNDGIFATVTFKTKNVTSDANGSFTLTSAGTKDKEGNSISSSNTGNSVKVHVPSTVNTLDNLTIDGTTITGFDKNTLTYNVNTENGSITIGATATDSSSSVTGTGKKSLSYSKNNTFNIVVTSESGSKKTYTINVTRIDNRSDNNNLSSLSIKGIAFSFDPKTTTYNLNVEKSSVNISAVAEDSKSTITGATGEQTLKYGKNTFKINVRNEKGETKTYTLNITRPDNRSSNYNLKSLTLSEGKIDFKNSTTLYNITVDNKVEKITVSATLEDEKSSFVSGYGPRTIDLKDGNNTILIKVKNEKGTIKTWTINVNKDDGRDTNADLSTLTLSAGVIEFNKDILEYKTTVTYDVEKINVEAKAASEKAKINITNPNLKVGENTIIVKVTAENGAVKEYKIVVIRAEENKVLSNNNYLSGLLIEKYNISFDPNTFVYDLKIENEESLIIEATPSFENASVTVLGNENLKDGSVITISVTAENGETRNYRININKGDKSNGIPTNYFVIGGLFILLIILIIIIIIQKRKKKNEFYESNLINGVNSVYNNQDPNRNNINANMNYNSNENVMENSGIINDINSNVNNNNNNMNQNINSLNNNLINNNVNPMPNNINSTEKVENGPKKTINNPSGLTKVCSSCGRRVPYECNSCPYCLNDF